MMAVRLDTKGDCGHDALTLFRVLNQGSKEWWCPRCVADKIKEEWDE